MKCDECKLCPWKHPDTCAVCKKLSDDVAGESDDKHWYISIPRKNGKSLMSHDELMKLHSTSIIGRRA